MAKVMGEIPISYASLALFGVADVYVPDASKTEGTAVWNSEKQINKFLLKKDASTNEEKRKATVKMMKGIINGTE